MSDLPYSKRLNHSTHFITMTTTKFLQPHHGMIVGPCSRLLLVALTLALFTCIGLACGTVATSTDDSTIGQAFARKLSYVQVEGEGTVVSLLADDNDGSRHQRFIVKLASGQTLLMSHNIDIASRVEGLSKGDMVQFYGEYIWNSKGGIIHWTHRDPQRRHVAGWIKHKGKTYQ